VASWYWQPFYPVLDFSLTYWESQPLKRGIVTERGATSATVYDMGWIYNGTEFIKANKAQRQAYDKYLQHELIKEGLAEPYTVPAIALIGASLAGVVTVGSLGVLFWGPAKDIVDQAVEDIKDLPGEIKDAIIVAVDNAGVSTAEQPKFLSDSLSCLQAHPATVTILGQKVKDPLRGLKILNCMRKKGWADDIVIEGIARIFI